MFVPAAFPQSVGSIPAHGVKIVTDYEFSRYPTSWLLGLSWEHGHPVRFQAGVSLETVFEVK